MKSWLHLSTFLLLICLQKRETIAGLFGWLLHAIIVVFQYKGLIHGLWQENKIVMSQ